MKLYIWPTTYTGLVHAGVLLKIKLLKSRSMFLMTHDYYTYHHA